MKLAIGLMAVLLLAMSTAAFAAEVELSDIQRPVDAQVLEEEETQPAALTAGEPSFQEGRQIREAD